MNRKTFYVVTVTNGKLFFSYAFAVPNAYNLFPFIESLQKNVAVSTLNACDSKKSAVETASYWNDGWKNQNKYWDDAPFLYTIVY